MSQENAEPESGRKLRLFPGLRILAVKPSDFLPDMDGHYGISVGRTLAATALLACSLAVMRLVPSIAAGAIVIPLWLASIGAFVDGWRGASRGAVMAIVLPIYFSLIAAVAGLIFWCYALLHSAMQGSDLF